MEYITMELNMLTGGTTVDARNPPKFVTLCKQHCKLSHTVSS